MNLILTMAGHYQRFTLEGYKIPKYLLPWGEKTILSAILHHLDIQRVFENVFLIANTRDDAYVPHILETLRSFGLSASNLLMTNGTSGQAESALIGMSALCNLNQKSSMQPVLIHNIDTILLGRNFDEIGRMLKHNAGYVDVFSSSNHNYSYVILSNTSHIIDMAEKMVISNLATSGLYGFESPLMFKNFYQSDDIYITSVYKRMVQQKKLVIVGEIYKEMDTIVLGTPYEYLNASASYFNRSKLY